MRSLKGAGARAKKEKGDIKDIMAEIGTETGIGNDVEDPGRGSIIEVDGRDLDQGQQVETRGFMQVKQVENTDEAGIGPIGVAHLVGEKTIVMVDMGEMTMTMTDEGD
jgi:hypothetical protein